MSERGRLLVSCPDRPGIVAAVCQFLFEQGANVVDSDQHTDPETHRFFLRLEFDLEELGARLPICEQAFVPLARRFEMEARFFAADRGKRMAIFASKQDHCLVELLWRWRSGELPAEIACVVSNHEELRDRVEPHGIPFHHVPVTKETKPEAEALAREKVASADLLVLARYMQILSPEFVAAWEGRLINIHHSFLPAFVGAKPYRQAYARGVKLIGATAHYVTAELDAGPIIEQDVQRVGHRDDVKALERLGAQVERTVLARAVAWHLEDRIIVHGNKTVVFR